jgi:hypothetical protein
MKNAFIILSLYCGFIFVATSCNKPSSESEQHTVAAPASEPDPKTATIQLGETMIGELVKPGQTLVHVIQSPPEPPEERGQICFVYFDSAIGSEYVFWNPNTQRTVIYHSNGLVEIIPSGRTDTWDGYFTPPFCKAGRDENFRKIVRHDLLNPPAQKVPLLPKNSR